MAAQQETKDERVRQIIREAGYSANFSARCRSLATKRSDPGLLVSPFFDRALLSVDVTCAPTGISRQRSPQSNAMHYLDHNATSPLRPESLAPLTQALGIGGNPSSAHARGRAARALVEEAKEKIALLAGANAHEILFTSGATEAANLALAGAVEGAIHSHAQGEGSRITRLFISAIEAQRRFGAGPAPGRTYSRRAGGKPAGDA